MTRIFDIADRYIDRLAAMQPIIATYFGVPGHETEMPDNSPAGDAAQAEKKEALEKLQKAAQKQDELNKLAAKQERKNDGKSVSRQSTEETCRETDCRRDGETVGEKAGSCQRRR